MTTTPAPLTGDSSFCTECGRNYPSDDLVRIGNSLVCANCKETYAQRLREGAPVAGVVAYGGFWRRAGALMLDGLILAVASFAVNSLFGVAAGGAAAANGANIQRFSALLGLSTLANMAIGIAYQVFFLTRNGATPGKLVLGLKVIRAGGGPVTALTAVGRYFAYILDYLILGIGFLMVAFDSERRALHDHLCGTRVIRVS